MHGSVYSIFAAPRARGIRGNKLLRGPARRGTALSIFAHAISRAFRLTPTLTAAGLASAGILAGCSGASRQASTSEEKLDEIRAIAAIARSQTQLGQAPVCVARLIEGDPSFERLTTTDLDEVHRHMVKNAGRHQNGPSANLVLDDAAIAGAVRNPVLGNACTGSAFFQFARVQFKGAEAVATAIKTDLPTCGRERVLFRLKHGSQNWEVSDVRVTSRSSPYVCEPRPSETWAKFVRLGS